MARSWTTLLAQFSLVLLAGTQAACGRVVEAQNTISQALDSINKMHERWDEAEIHRIAGQIAVSQLHCDYELAE